ncbi:hypothetical protein [Lentisalinibacter sediminis]|uniref:hypothetical protein n=1 Tax=Lentisalinibacter sediminis TaxID=2992237 RepID=UPI003866AF7B
MRRDVRLVPIIIFCCLAAGCTSFWQAGSSSGSRDGVSSSLVDYLYPKGEVPPEQPEGIPRLDLPLRAGIAFVPSRYISGFGSGIGIPEATVLYWTIVGAYLVKGTKNAVSTGLQSNEALRRERTGSFAAAMDEMTVNLETELERFEDRLKSEPTLAEVNWEEGKGGSGTFGLFALPALLAMALAAPQLTSSERRS